MVILDKAVLHPEGLDRAGALHRLAKVRIDGRPGDRLESLELSRGGDEDSLDDIKQHSERQQDLGQMYKNRSSWKTDSE